MWACACVLHKNYFSGERRRKKRRRREGKNKKKTDMWKREITTDCVGFKGVVVKRVAWVAFLLNL